MKERHLRRSNPTFKLCLAGLAWLAVALVQAEMRAAGTDSNTKDIRGGDREVYNVRAFGAHGDGKTLDSTAINRAIEACAGAGGGTVYVPAGTYTVRLASNNVLYLDSTMTGINVNALATASIGTVSLRPKP